MPRTTSNLTNTELRRIFNISERSPLYEHIKQTTNDYLSTYQGGRSWGSIRGDIKRQIILIWKDFADKYGPNRSDMNEIKERAQTDNYNLTQRGLTSQSYGASGALEREILRWNSEECHKLMNILEYEGRAGIKHKKRKHKSKKKRSKKKRSRKKSKKIKNKRTKNKRMRGSGTYPTDFGKTI